MASAQGLVTSVATMRKSDGDNPTVTMGRQADMFVSEVHGKWYQAVNAGICYAASTLAAGIVVPFIAINMASKFTLHNPAGSGVNLELIDLTILQTPGTALITGLGMAFQSNVTATGVPGTLTVSTGALGNLKIGAGNNQKAILYSAATLVNAAIANLSPVIWLANNVATTIITQGQTIFEFDGKIIMPPDSTMSLCDSITGTQSAAAATIKWAEWPV